MIAYVTLTAFESWHTQVKVDEVASILIVLNYSGYNPTLGTALFTESNLKIYTFYVFPLLSAHPNMYRLSGTELSTVSIVFINPPELKTLSLHNSLKVFKGPAIVAGSSIKIIP